jgi:rubrerythrin
METCLMNGLLSALYRGWRQCCDALHPDPHPTLLEALRDTYLATAHTVTQFTQDAERMEYPQFRAQLLRMAAEGQGHVTWLHDTLLARGEALPTCTCPPTVAPTSWAALVKEVAAERRAYEALLEPMQLAEQADPEIAEGFRRLRAAKQQHREVLLDMLVKSDPYALPRSPAAGRPLDTSAVFERAHVLSPLGSARRGTCARGKSSEIHVCHRGSSPMGRESSV